MVDATSLLQSAIVLFSAFLVISQLVVRTIESSETEIGRWATNAIIGALGGLWYLMAKSILSISGLILQSNQEVEGLQAALEPMVEFVVLSGILFGQYILYQANDDSDPDQILVDTIARFTIVLFIIVFFRFVSVGAVFCC